MPIILAANQSDTAVAIVLVVATAVSITIAVVARVLPPRKVSGPPRVPRGRPAWPLFVVLFWSAGLYVLCGSWYRAYCEQRASRQAGHEVRLDPFPQTDQQTAVLYTLPPLVGLAALLLGDYAVRRTTEHDLGLSPRRLIPGVARGLLGIVIVLPPLFCLSELMELFYRAIHYQHPAEHPLLKVLGKRPDPSVAGMIFFGAWVLAPLWEELAFRGHVQTLLRRLFSSVGSPALPSSVIPASKTTVMPGTVPPVLEYASPLPLREPTARHTWAAIVCTSLLFALVHPLWSQPVIFFLALCLGYAYERTRNLWVPITIHSMFNTFSTLLFLGTR